MKRGRCAESGMPRRSWTASDGVEFGSFGGAEILVVYTAGASGTMAARIQRAASVRAASASFPGRPKRSPDTWAGSARAQWPAKGPHSTAWHSMATERVVIPGTGERNTAPRTFRWPQQVVPRAWTRGEDAAHPASQGTAPYSGSGNWLSLGTGVGSRSIQAASMPAAVISRAAVRDHRLPTAPPRTAPSGRPP